MKANEVIIVTANQEKGKVFFHMKDGKTIVRTIRIDRSYGRDKVSVIYYNKK